MKSCGSNKVVAPVQQALRKFRSSSSGSRGVRSHRCFSSSNGCGSSTTTTGVSPPGTIRSLSSSESSSTSFSSYLYPLRTEAPIVTQSTAAEAAAAGTIPTDDSSKENDDASKFSRRSFDNIDHFDDMGSLDIEQQRELLEQQKREHATSSTTTMSSILPQRPSHIPPNVPSTELVLPQTEITTLDNGVRVVSRETYGQVSTIGILTDVGSRNEAPHQVGVTHLLDLLAFSGSTENNNNTNYDTALQITQLLQDWGGTRFVSCGREQTVHCIDILRPNVTKAMDLLSSTYLYPKFDPMDIEDAKRTIEFQAMDMPKEIILEQAIQTAAYGVDQQLGKQHFCPLEALPNISEDTLREFWIQHVWNQPQGLVIAGAGIAHEQLVSMANDRFGALSSSSSTEERGGTVPSVYRGGDQLIQKAPNMNNPHEEGMTRVAVAFELEGGWHSDELVTACVLQTLLGGGNSFSAGGPGKGMYSRLYRQVLNRYSWVESAEAFTSIHNESGLWGISGSCSDPKQAQHLVHVIVDNLYRLSIEHVSDEEISRARNMLKCNVLTQLESRLVLFEDLGRQVLTYGQREEIDETCRRIDSVTKEQIKHLAQKALAANKQPTIAAVGENLDYVPRQKEISKWLGMSSSSSSSQ